MRARMLLGSLLLLALTTTCGAAPAAPHVQVTRDARDQEFGLHVVDAPLSEIGAALGRAFSCAVEMPDKLGRQCLTLDLAPRPPDRLLRILARRADATISIRYRLERKRRGDGETERRRDGETETPGEKSPAPRLPGSPVPLPLLANQPMSLEIARPTELALALQQMDVTIDVAEGIVGRVRVFAARTPLSRVLDQIATQLDCEWRTIVCLERAEPADAASAGEERQWGYYTGLAELSPSERREELTADLEALERLPPAARPAALERAADSLVSLAMRVEQTPIEHRGGIRRIVASITADYAAVLSPLPRERRANLGPLVQALLQLATRLSTME